MATRKPVDDKRVFQSSKTTQVLLLHTSFVYDVEIYKCTPRSFNLEDSKTLASKKYVKDSIQYFMKNDIQYKKRTTLVAAPLTWLLENKFTENVKQTQNG